MYTNHILTSLKLDNKLPMRLHLACEHYICKPFAPHKRPDFSIFLCTFSSTTQQPTTSRFAPLPLQAHIAPCSSTKTPPRQPPLVCSHSSPLTTPSPTISQFVRYFHLLPPILSPLIICTRSPFLPYTISSNNSLSSTSIHSLTLFTFPFHLLIRSTSVPFPLLSRDPRNAGLMDRTSSSIAI